MREQLIQYVNLLFAGASDCEDIKQEILQNTLDRYDDLVAQGKAPEAAYRLAISGIGDINEILGTHSHTAVSPAPAETAATQPETEEDRKRKKIRGIAVAMYILCAVPVILLSELGADIPGVCLTLALVACATYLMIITGKKDDDDDDDDRKEKAASPQEELKRSIGKMISTIGLAAYLVVSFLSGAWAVTWIIFPIAGCVKGLVNAIIDLKEANQYEN